LSTEDTAHPTRNYLEKTIGAAFIALLLLALVQQDRWWGIHFLGFMPTTMPWAFLLGAVFLLLSDRMFGAVAPPGGTPGEALGGEARRRAWIIAALGIGAAAFVVFSTTPVATDMYGDARRNMRILGDSAGAFNPDWLRWIFSPDIFHSDNGERFLLSTVRLIAYATGLSPLRAFYLFNAFWGGVFVSTWLLFVISLYNKAGFRVLMGAVGLCTGALLMFFGHTEIYAASLALFLVYCVVTVQYLRTRRRGWVVALVPLFFLAAKAHAVNIILAPVLLTTVAHYFFGDRPRFQRLLTWKGSLLFFVAPIFLLGLGYYFFVTADHAVGHVTVHQDMSRAHDHIFLPLFSANEPPGRIYTLFSPVHLFDYLNLVLFWSVPALFLVTIGAFRRRHGGHRSPPEVLFSGTILILYAALFFAVNPVLTMARDWDFFSLPVPALLVFCALIVRHRENDRAAFARLAGPTFALCLLTLPLFIVNLSPRMAGERLLAIGIHGYRTYGQGSAFIINAAVRSVEFDDVSQMRRRIQAMDEMRPYATTGSDPEFSGQATRVATVLLDKGDFERAERYAREAYDYDPSDPHMHYILGLALLRNGKPEAGRKHAEELVRKVSGNESYLALAIECADAVGDADAAARHRRELMKLRSDDETEDKEDGDR
jgi:hypothetical protein